MTAAAELMAITQPAVSRLIRDFEFATRLKLFDRRGNQLTPTREAVTLMHEVERAFIGLSRVKLTKVDLVTPSDLINERMITLEPGTIFAMRVEVALADIPRSSTIETRLSHTALTLVSESVGIAIIDPSSATEFRGRGVVVKPFSVFLDAGFLAIRRGDIAPNDLARSFVDKFWIYHAALL